MSTFTKEQLIARADHLLCVGKAFIADHHGYDGVAKDVELFKIALASLEAEAAITVGDDGGDALAYRRLIQTFAPGTKLYTAPPAPVAVPDEMDGHGGVCCEVSYADGWNACRAAMLQGGNSPVTQDGWVACSERMPEENSEQEVLACFKGGDISTLYYFEGRWDDAYGIVPIRQDVTHWMPLPAAPQQEVKP